MRSFTVTEAEWEMHRANLDGSDAGRDVLRGFLARFDVTRNMLTRAFGSNTVSAAHAATHQPGDAWTSF